MITIQEIKDMQKKEAGWDNFPLMLKEWIFAHPAPASFLMAIGLFGIGGFILMLCGI